MAMLPAEQSPHISRIRSICIAPLILCALFTSNTGRAAQPMGLQTASATVSHPGVQWLRQGFAPVVQAPPINDLEEAQRMMAMKALRTPARISEIEAENTRPTDSFFYEAAGIDAGFAGCPVQRWASMTMAIDMVDVLFAQKKRFSRMRPSDVLPALDPVVPVPWHAAYPSGHATQARVLAQLFSTWYPDKTAIFDRLAIRIARNREIAGLHYPSDSLAGFNLGDQIFLESMNNPEFLEILKNPCSTTSGSKVSSWAITVDVGLRMSQSLFWLNDRTEHWKAMGDARTKNRVQRIGREFIPR